MDDFTKDLVLGIALLVGGLLLLARYIWRRRPVAEPEPEPDVSELLTQVVEYPTLPHPDEQRFDEDVPDRPAWMRKRDPERERRWAAQKRGEVWSDDRG